MSNAKRTGDDQRGGPPALIGEALKRYLDASGLSKHLRDWPVLDAWRQAVGPELAKRARPVAYRAGELVVEVESAPLLSQLKGFSGDGYRRAANSALGEDRIQKINFKLKR